MGLVDPLQALLPGEVLVLLLAPQLAVAGLGGHKEGLLEGQPLACQRAHEGLQQGLRIALLHGTHTLLFAGMLRECNCWFEIPLILGCKFWLPF